MHPNPAAEVPLALRIRVDVQYTITDRRLLMLWARGLAMQYDVSLPADVPDAVRTLLPLTTPDELDAQAATYGLVMGDTVVTATVHPCGLDPDEGTVVLEVTEPPPTPAYGRPLHAVPDPVDEAPEQQT